MDSGVQQLYGIFSDQKNPSEEVSSTRSWQLHGIAFWDT